VERECQNPNLNPQQPVRFAKMPSHIRKATGQAAVLNVTSSVLAQLLKAYRSSQLPGNPSIINPLGLDLISIFQFLVFCLLSTPPNVLWQEFLERRFPGYGSQGNQKLKVDDDGKVSKAGIDRHANDADPVGRGL